MIGILPPVLVITDRHQAKRPLDDIAAALFAAGGRWLSLREKDLPPTERVALLRRLVELGRPIGATVTVHDDIAAALATGARGVHLPRDGDVRLARERLGPGALIGISTHNLEEAKRAAAAGADYATLSPIFLSASKPGYGPGLGLAGLTGVAAAVPIPIVALGGIDAGNAGTCRVAGAAAVAVMGSVMRADDPAAVLRGLIT